MKINQKTYSILVFSFSVLATCLAVLFFLNYVSIDFVLLSVGFTQLFDGLKQISMVKQIDSKGNNKGNKKVGIASIMLGLIIIIGVGIKMIVW